MHFRQLAKIFQQFPPHAAIGQSFGDMGRPTSRNSHIWQLPGMKVWTRSVPQGTRNTATAPWSSCLGGRTTSTWQLRQSAQSRDHAVITTKAIAVMTSVTGAQTARSGLEGVSEFKTVVIA